MIFTYGYQTIGRYHSKWLFNIKLVFGNPIRCAKSTIPFAMSQKSILHFWNHPTQLEFGIKLQPRIYNNYSLRGHSCAPNMWASMMSITTSKIVCKLFPHPNSYKHGILDIGGQRKRVKMLSHGSITKTSQSMSIVCGLLNILESIVSYTYSQVQMKGFFFFFPICLL